MHGIIHERTSSLLSAVSEEANPGQGKDKKRPDNARYKCMLCTKSFHRPYLLRKHVVSHWISKKPAQLEANKNRQKAAMEDAVKPQANCASSFVAPSASEVESKMETDVAEECSSPVVDNTAPLFIVVEPSGDAPSASSSASIAKEETPKHPYQCSLCPKSFPKPRTLMLHEKRHSIVRPFACNFCQKPFARTRDLRVHERIHTGEMPFRCAFCEERFRSSALRLAHERRFHE